MLFFLIVDLSLRIVTKRRNQYKYFVVVARRPCCFIQNLSDKSDKNVGTVGAHVGETVLDKDKIGASSNSSSIATHVSNLIETVVKPTGCVQDILAAHSIKNSI